MRGQSGQETMASLLCAGLKAKAMGSGVAGAAAALADDARKLLGVEKYSSRWWRATMEAAVRASLESSADGPAEILALTRSVTYVPPGLRWDECARQSLGCKRAGADAAAAEIAERLPRSDP